MRVQMPKGMGIAVGLGGGLAVGIPMMIAWGYAGLIFATGVGLSSGLFYETTRVARRQEIMLLMAFLTLLLTLILTVNVLYLCVGCS